eukprot:COSAG02_NODE_57718_length_279_cov_1.566667_1_plen_24_part_01
MIDLSGILILAPPVRQDLTGVGIP